MKGALKKVINYAILALLIIPCAFLLAACGDKDKGNNGNGGNGGGNQQESTIAGNYVFDSMSVSWAEGITAEQKAAILAGDPGTDEDDMTEAEFFAFIHDMMSSEMFPVNFSISLEISGTSGRLFSVMEGYNIRFATDGNYYETTYNDETNRDEFTIGNDTYYRGSEQIFVVDETHAYLVVDNSFTIGDATYTRYGWAEGYENGYVSADEGTTKIAITLNAFNKAQFTIGDVTYTFDYCSTILNAEDDTIAAVCIKSSEFTIGGIDYYMSSAYVVSGNYYEEDHSQISIGDDIYTLNLIDKIVTDEDGETVATIANNKFTLGGKTFSIVSGVDYEIGLVYYSYNKDTGILTMYEDKEKTIISQYMLSLLIGNDTISWILGEEQLGAELSMVAITFNFKKA